MQHIIRKGIPMPSRAGKGRRSSSPAFPFADMEIGDAIVVDGNKLKSLRNAAYQYRKSNADWEFSTCKMDDDDAQYPGKGILWRVTKEEEHDRQD